MLTEARSLLLEALDWIGLVNITGAEEERAEELQERIEEFVARSLQSAPSLDPKAISHYNRVLYLRLQAEMAEKEKRLAQQLLQSVTQKSTTDRVQSLYAVRRHTMAYEQWKRTERALQDAEAAHYRSLTFKGSP